MNMVQHDKQFLEYVRTMRGRGMTEARIAMSLGLGAVRYRKILHDCLNREKQKKKEAAE